MPVADANAVLQALNQGARSAAQLGQALQVSQPTVSRWLSPLMRKQQVLRLGAARSARYARVQLIPELGASHWPIYRVDAQGQPHLWATLHWLVAGQCHVEMQVNVAAARELQGLHDGLPYFLQDQRPAGFLGRNVPQRYPELRLPQRVGDWTDTHYLRYLTQQGWDAVSDLIVGDAALNHYLSSDTPAISASQRLEQYAQMAMQVTAGGLPGSSAHGEHPKFLAAIDTEGDVEQRLIKFSPPRHTDVGQCWSDLLVAEQHAHVVLRRVGLATCDAQVHIEPERTYLEMPRFDRVGARGRRGVVSLFAVDTALYAQLDDWVAAAQRLQRDGRLVAEEVRRIQLLAAFGALIANTDRHFGNLALFDDYSGRFTLAPSYDMLPMLFAPQHDQVHERTFNPPPPTAATLQVWHEAHALAGSYWQELATDVRLSERFRQICQHCVEALRSRLAKLPA